MFDNIFIILIIIVYNTMYTCYSLYKIQYIDISMNIYCISIFSNIMSMIILDIIVCLISNNILIY